VNKKNDRRLKAAQMKLYRRGTAGIYKIGPPTNIDVREILRGQNKMQNIGQRN
jgi:hypothetical protein